MPHYYPAVVVGHPCNDMEFNERRTEFLESYNKLIDEFKVDIMSHPTYVPDGQGGWRLVIQMDIVDTSEVPIKSPFTVD